MIIAQTYISVLPLCTFYLFKFTFKIMGKSLFIEGMIILKSLDLTILSLKRKGIRTEKVLKNQCPDRLSNVNQKTDKHRYKNAQSKNTCKEKEE